MAAHSQWQNNKLTRSYHSVTWPSTKCAFVHMRKLHIMTILLLFLKRVWMIREVGGWEMRGLLSPNSGFIMQLKYVQLVILCIFILCLYYNLCPFTRPWTPCITCSYCLSHAYWIIINIAVDSKLQLHTIKQARVQFCGYYTPPLLQMLQSILLFGYYIPPLP